MKRPKHYISEYSNLLNEWNWEKNKNLSPEAIGTGSTKKVWWKCCVCGSEWQATPNSRSGKKRVVVLNVVKKSLYHIEFQHKLQNVVH